MKKIIMGILLYLVTSHVIAQPKFTYTFDSSVVSILFSNDGKMDKDKKKLQLDFLDKWKYKKADSVSITIKGNYLVVDDFKKPTISTTINCNLFGSKYAVGVKSGNFSIIKKIPTNKIYANPIIILQCPNIKKKKDGIIWIDSFDIASII